ALPTASCARSNAPSRSSSGPRLLRFCAAAARLPAFLRGLAAAARPTGAGILAALVLLVDRRPGPPLRFLLGDATLFVAFLDMLFFSVLLRSIGSTGHAN